MRALKRFVRRFTAWMTHDDADERLRAEIEDHLTRQTEEYVLAGLGAVRADARLLISEKAGTRSFFLWGKLIMAAGRPGAWQRKPLLLLYVLFLLVLIVTVVPVSLTLQALLRPLLKGWLTKMTAHFERPSGDFRGART